MKIRHYLIVLIVLQVCQLLAMVGMSEVESPKDVACSLVQWVPFVRNCEATNDDD